ncbi:hypothetical protein BDZ97DRAFT_1779777 [Flammula alnicola]|nr:hypothetical protein BDZ97DRAFT_1779777 [Flammula alnicola]
MSDAVLLPVPSDGCPALWDVQCYEVRKLLFILCGALAGILWWGLITAQKNDLATVTQSMKTTVIIVAAIYTAAMLIGLLGFLGALFKKNGFVKTFYILLCAVLSLQVGGSIWFLVTFYRNRGQTLDQCINGSTDTNKINFCKAMDAYRRVPQGAMIASVVVPIVLQAYACYVVYQYSKRLERQRADELRSSKVFVPPVGPGYQPVMRNDETYPLAQPSMQYPYADAPHSFGHQKQRSFGGDEVINKV